MCAALSPQEQFQMSLGESVIAAVATFTEPIDRPALRHAVARMLDDTPSLHRVVHETADRLEWVDRRLDLVDVYAEHDARGTPAEAELQRQQRPDMSLLDSYTSCDALISVRPVIDTPLVHVELLEYEDREGAPRMAVLHVAHHVIADGIALIGIVHNVLEHYGAVLREGEPQPTPPFSESRFVGGSRGPSPWRAWDAELILPTDDLVAASRELGATVNGYLTLQLVRSLIDCRELLAPDARVLLGTAVNKRGLGESGVRTHLHEVADESFMPCVELDLESLAGESDAALLDATSYRNASTDLATRPTIIVTNLGNLTPAFEQLDEAARLASLALAGTTPQLYDERRSPTPLLSLHAVSLFGRSLQALRMRAPLFGGAIGDSGRDRAEQLALTFRRRLEAGLR